jgi:anti-sigma-K factor RskA
MTAQTLPCTDAETALGALVLGALDPSERDQVEAHVRGCAHCASALAEIAPMAGLLHRAGITAGDLQPAPPEVLERALAQVHQESSAEPGETPSASAEVVALRRRRLPLLAAAAVAVLALVLGGAWWSQHQVGPGSVTARGASASAGVKATVVMTPVDAGTSMNLTLSGVTPGQECSLVAVSSTGVREVTSTWVANYEGEAEITGTAALTLATIERLDITTPDGRTLLAIDVPA